MANACVFCIVVYKLAYQQQSFIIVLFEIDKDLKVRFYYTHLTFCLTICLQIKSNGESLVDGKEVVNQ